jgi:hypothetical protein
MVIKSVSTLAAKFQKCRFKGAQTLLLPLKKRIDAFLDIFVKAVVL